MLTGLYTLCLVEYQAAINLHWEPVRYQHLTVRNSGSKIQSEQCLLLEATLNRDRYFSKYLVVNMPALIAFILVQHESCPDLKFAGGWVITGFTVGLLFFLKKNRQVPVFMLNNFN